MARVSANAGGEIVQFLNNQEEKQNPTPPPEAAYNLQFDEATNGGLLLSYGQNSAAFAMPGGTLTVNGVPATINPPSAAYAALAMIPNLLVKLQNKDPLTTDEQKTLFLVLLRGQGLI